MMAHRGAAAGLALGLLVPLLAHAALGATANQVTLLPQQLPQAVSQAAAVWDGRDRPGAGCPGGCAYLFGGSSGGRVIVRFNPRDGTVSRMSARLPTDLHQPAAVWTGSRIYVLGGGTDQVFAYDPDNGTVRALDARLPAPQHGAAVVWTGTYAFLFGGMEDGVPTSRILRFDPAHESLAMSQVQLPGARFAAAAGWDGSHAYVVGGLDGAEAPTEAYRYDPASDTASTVAVPLVRDAAYAAYPSDGRYVYLVGGYRAHAPSSNEIVRFDMATLASEVLPERLPSLRVAAAAASAGDRAFVFGGDDEQGQGKREILSILTPGRPLATIVPSPPGSTDSSLPASTGPSAAPSFLWALAAGGGALAAAAVAALGILAVRRVRRSRPQPVAARLPSPQAAAETALQVEGLSVQDQGRTLVGPVSLGVPAGSLTLVLGPSGAGKSSLLRAIAGLVPCKGRIQVRGRWVVPGAPSAKAALGYVPQGLQLYTNLTPLANLAYFGAQFGLRAAEARARGAQLLADLGLEELENRPLDRLSGGQQRRVSIAVALVHQPALVVLDEPTSGLDLANRKALWMLLQRLARERGLGVLASSHFIDDADYADQVAILARGRMVALGSPRALIQSLPGEGRCVEVEFEALDPAARLRLEELAGRLRSQGRVEWVELRLFSARFFAKDPRAAARALPEVLHRNGFRVRSTRLDDIQMEDAFAFYAKEAP
jgi:ABC-2 type transport system ATP-binding protein